MIAVYALFFFLLCVLTAFGFVTIGRGFRSLREALEAHDRALTSHSKALGALCAPSRVRQRSCAVCGQPLALLPYRSASVRAWWCPICRVWVRGMQRT